MEIPTGQHSRITCAVTVCGGRGETLIIAQRKTVGISRSQPEVIRRSSGEAGEVCANGDTVAAGESSTQRHAGSITRRQTIVKLRRGGLAVRIHTAAQHGRVRGNTAGGEGRHARRQVGDNN